MERDSPRIGFDRLAIGLSTLCVLHCVLSVVLVAVLSTATTFLTDPIIHRAGMAGALVLAAIALRQGYIAHGARMPAAIGFAGLAVMALGLALPHGWPEVMATVTGVSVLAFAHLMNARARA